MILRNTVKTLDEHPVLKIVSFCIVVVGITYSVISFYYGNKIQLLYQQHEEEKSFYEAQLMALDEGLYLDNFFDISKVLIDVNHVKPISKNLYYFEKEGFYANIRSRNLTFESLAMSNYLKSIGITDKKIIEFMKEVALSEVSIYSWTIEKEAIAFELDGQHRIFKPTIIVQYYPYEQVAAGINEHNKFIPKEANQSITYTEDDVNNSKIDPIKVKNKLPSKLLFNTLNANFSRANRKEDFLFRVLNVQLDDDYTYVQSLQTYKNRSINNKSLDVYVWNELITFSSSNGMYVISVSIPTTRYLPEQGISSSITAWFNDLKIIKDF